jgi:hypothetical protein
VVLLREVNIVQLFVVNGSGGLGAVRKCSTDWSFSASLRKRSA